MHPTLILGDEPRIVIPIARSLHRQGIPVLAAAFGASARAVRSRAVQQFFRIDQGDSHVAVQSVLDLLRRFSIDWVIPSNDSALSFLAAHFDELRTVSMLACPHPTAAAIVLDKQQTMRAAAECGIGIPNSYRFPTLADLRNARASIRFPVIAKPFNKEVDAAFKIRYYLDFAPLERDYLNDAAYGARYLLQEYAEGEGAGIELLMAGGQPSLLFAHRRLLEYPSTGGVSVVAAADPLIPELVESSVRLLNHIGWEGVAMVEFRYDRAMRRATLLEINGRYWGSLGLSAAAGVDFPFAAWQAAHRLPVTASRDYQPGIQARWTCGMLLRTHDLFRRKDDGMPRPSPWREMFRGVHAFRPGVRDMLWSWKDPRPALDETRRVFTGILRSSVKTAVRQVIPPRLLTKLRTYRSLPSPVAQVYARCQLRRAWARPRQALPKDIRCALFLCHGNIIRSPMAEALFRRSSTVAVRSAGLHAIAGRRADCRALRIAPEFDVSLDQHAATPVTEQMVHAADVIFVMDGQNEANFLHRFPGAREKVRLLGAFAPQPLPDCEIPDPYEGSEQDVRDCYLALNECVLQITARVKNETVAGNS